MFCPECGIEIPDNAKFCTKCGALTAREETPEAATAPSMTDTKNQTAPEAITEVASESKAASEAAESSPRKKTKPKIIAAVVAAILVIGGIGGFAAYSHSQAQVYTLLAAPQAEGYNADDATPMPVEVTGTDEQGNEVDEVFYVTPDNGIEMPKGEYELAFPDPIASGSSVFVPGNKTTKARVGDDGWTLIIDDKEQIAGSISVTFELVAPEDVTDEMIEKLKDWMEKAGIDESEIGEFVDAVAKARQERLDQIAAEEESARKAAEEEAARKAEEERKAAEEAANREITQSEAEAIARDYFIQNYPDKWEQGWTETDCKAVFLDSSTVQGYEVRFYDPAHAAFTIVNVKPDGSVMG